MQRSFAQAMGRMVIALAVALATCAISAGPAHPAMAHTAMVLAPAVKPRAGGEPSASPITATCPISGPPAPVINGLIHGIAVIDAHDAWAVGDTPRGNGEATLIEHWNGTTWTPTPSPNAPQGPNTLLAVAALSRNDVWAVGAVDIVGSHLIALAEHWDGRAWRLVPTTQSGIGGGLTAVAAVSSRDVWAVGSSNLFGHDSPTIEHWDGRRWMPMPIDDPGPGGGALYGVSARSSHDVWAVGLRIDWFKGTLVEHWDGQSWRVVPSPNLHPGQDNKLTGVAARAAHDVWAVGTVLIGGIDDPVVEHWNGRRWGLVRLGAQELPLTNSAPRALGVDPTGGLWTWGRAWDPAVKDDRPLLARRVQGHWQVLPVPARGLMEDLAPTSGRLWAAVVPSSAAIIPGHPQPVVLRWTGQCWQNSLMTRAWPTGFISRYPLN